MHPRKPLGSREGIEGRAGQMMKRGGGLGCLELWDSQ